MEEHFAFGIRHDDKFGFWNAMFSDYYMSIVSFSPCFSLYWVYGVLSMFLSVLLLPAWFSSV
jgi:hypothetical protein